jgi:hypothetical protein
MVSSIRYRHLVGITNLIERHLPVFLSPFYLADANDDARQHAQYILNNRRYKIFLAFLSFLNKQ